MSLLEGTSSSYSHDKVNYFGRKDISFTLEERLCTLPLLEKVEYPENRCHPKTTVLFIREEDGRILKEGYYLKEEHICILFVNWTMKRDILTEGRRITYSVGEGKWDPDEFPLEEFKRMFVFIFLQALRCPMTQINGFKIINDYTGTNLKHLKVCTPQNLYLEYHIAYQCVPGRYKEVHFVNGSAMLALVWSMAKHVLSKKIKER
ncbi:hypothetical protein AVEN_47826-1, partial [Araneus ventricosus]